MCDIDEGEDATDMYNNEANRRVGNDSIRCGRTGFRRSCCFPILLCFDYQTFGSEGLIDWRTIEKNYCNDGYASMFDSWKLAGMRTGKERGNTGYGLLVL